MPLDGIFLNRISGELSELLVGGRVDKVHQPARESIVLAIRAQAGNHKLLISASASNPRLHLTTIPQDNPKSPPMFCMLMRKHLTNAKLLEIRQIGLDRVLHLRFETVNEFGDKVVLTLAVEIMGRHSNVILIGPDNRVIDAVKRITDEMSRVRPILPGVSYTLAPAQERLDIFTAAPSEILARLMQTPELPLPKALLGAMEGMSPLVCREISYSATRGADTIVGAMTEEQQTRLRFFLSQMSDSLRTGQTRPIMLVDVTGKPTDFSYLDIHQYGHTLIGRACESYSALLDSFYSERDRIDRMHQRGSDLLRLLVNLSDRTTRKLVSQREELQASTERETLKIYGDLLNSYLHLLEKGMTKAVVQNYYDENSAEVEIPLDVRLTPSQNAQRYYAQYRKADTAERKLRALIAQGEGELQYFDTVFDELARAGLESELAAIRSELASEGYVRSVLKRGMKEERLAPIRYRSDDGFTILCGRNNLQNERLTLKESRNGDVWFHTQKIPGSHVVVVTEGQQVPNQTLEQAAILAAYHSKARESGKVPVDYTQIRNVKKHPANKPGLVIYEPYQTAIVDPDPVLAARLLQK